MELPKLVKTIEGMQIREMNTEDENGYKFLIYAKENANTFNFNYLADNLKEAITICKDYNKS